MRRSVFTKGSNALTATEVLAIISIIALGVLLFLASRAVGDRRAKPKQCQNNLKQIGLAFRTWALDGGDQYTTGVSVRDGGTKELIPTGKVYVHFLAMSNELTTAEILVCPQDKLKTVYTKFDSGLSDSNVSYFVGVDALDTWPQSFLSGDRNLLSNGKPLEGLVTLETNTPLNWSRAIHNRHGNISFADGSVQYFNNKGLRYSLREQGLKTNRIVIP